MMRHDLADRPDRMARVRSGSALSRPRFRNSEQDRGYEVNGVVTVPMLAPERCIALRRRLTELLPPLGPGFSSSVLSETSLRKAIHRLVLAIVGPALDGMLTNYRAVLASTVIRSPGSDLRDLPLHQDWSFVDETRARSMSVWLPLQDVSTANGCLQVVPGSHRHEQPLRFVGSAFRYAEMESELRARYLVDLPMRTGESALFDHRLIHGSRPNASAAARYAIGIVLVPETVPVHIGLRRSGGSISFEDVPDDFLLDENLADLAR